MRTATRPGWFVRHPYLTASLLCHAIFLTAFSAITLDQREIAQQSAVHAEVARSEQTKLQRLTDRMKATEKALRDAAGDAMPADPPQPDADQGRDPLQQAQRIAQRLDKQIEAIKAKKLAALLKIPPEQARAKLRAESKPDLQNKLATVDDIARKANEAAGLLKDGAGGVGIHGDDSPGGSGAAGLSGESTVLSDNPDVRTYGAYRSPAPVDSAGLRVGFGRMVGVGGMFANRVFIDSWYVIGPFAGQLAASLRTAYPPETDIDLDAAYEGKAGRLLKWRYVQAPLYPLIPPDAATNAVWYGYTEISSDRPRDVVLSVGADDDAMLWLNDQLIWTSEDNDKPWYHTHFNNLRDKVATLNLTEQMIHVHLRAGRNRVLFKLYNGAMSYFFSLVLSDA